MDYTPDIAEIPVKKHRKAKHRSALTSGARLFCPETVDGRVRAARRFADLVDSISSDLGGADRLSTAQVQLARRAATLSVQCETLEMEALRGAAEFDVNLCVTICNALCRLFVHLGVTRRLKDITGDENTVDAALDRVVARRKERADGS